MEMEGHKTIWYKSIIPRICKKQKSIKAKHSENKHFKSNRLKLIELGFNTKHKLKQ